jgi:ABC-2 type transport system ATP-binding protein
MGQVVRALRAIPGVQDVTFTELGDSRGVYSVMSRRGDEMRANLAKAVVEQGWGLLGLETVTMSLEEIFLRLTTTEEA